MPASGLNQVIYTFGQVESAIRAAKIGLKTADDQLKISQQAVIKDVSAAFYDVLLAKELNKLAQENLEQKKRNHEESKKKAALGVGTDFDVLVSRVAMENARPGGHSDDQPDPAIADEIRFSDGVEQ